MRLLTMLLIISANAFGQNNKSNTAIGGLGSLSSGTTSIAIGYSALQGYPKCTQDNPMDESRKFDTTKILMLVSDTSIISTTSYNVLPGIIAYWLHGYLVRKINYGSKMTECQIAGIWHDHYYKEFSDAYCLDEYKKPLPKNIIVWQAK